MKNKVVLLLVSLLMVGTLLSGCGGSTPAPVGKADDAAAVTPPNPAPAGEAVTLRLWALQNEAFNEGQKALIDKYMAAHPNVTISLEIFDYDTYIQTLQTALPAKTEADIMQLFGSWVCSYAQGGSLAAVPAEVMTLEAAQDQFFSAPLGGYTCGGKLYGIPEEFNIEYGAALVNTRIADEAGLKNIAAGWNTWDDFIADVKKVVKVQDGVMTRAGYNFTGADGIPATFYAFILQNGGQYLTPEGFSVNTPEGQKALTLMKRFVDEGLVDPTLFNNEQNWVGSSFFEETSAIGLVGPWAVPEYGKDAPEVAAVTQYVPLPYFGDKPTFVAASGWGLTVSANSKVQKAAWDFVTFAAVNPENSLQWNLASGTLPALKANATGTAADNLVTKFPHFKPFLGILPYAQPEGAFPDRDLVWYEITYPRILNFLQGNMSLDETLETIDREVNESF